MYQRYPAVQPLPHPSLSYTNTDIGNIMPDSSENLPYNMSLQVLREFDRPIVYSLSPGTSVTPAMAKDVSGLVNLYRITADDWDKWDDVRGHFDVSRWLYYCIFYFKIFYICSKLLLNLGYVVPSIILSCKFSSFNSESGI
jgi:hypothetical protein